MTLQALVRRLALGALLTLSGGVLVQAAAAAGDTAGPARPKLKYDGHFSVRSNDNRPWYSLYYYFETRGGFSDLESHIFYPPPYHVVTTEDGKIKHDIDPHERTLTLWVRQPSPFACIERDLRKELFTVAVDKYSVEILPGTDPYRISVLPLNTARFEFTKTKTRSGVVDGARLKEGDIAVHFYEVSEEEARTLVDELQRDITQLLFRYTFRAISDEVCSAKFESHGVQDVDLFKKVKGKGAEGLVVRHQAARIADQLVSDEIFTIRCAADTQFSDLTGILMNRLAKVEKREVATWDDLDKLIALDPDSFRADVTRALNTVEKMVDQEQALEAFSHAESVVRSTAGEHGVDLGFKELSLELSAGFADTGSESRAGARKVLTDALSKQGLSVDWDGEKFVPKSVDVHTVADLDASWARGVEFNYQIPEGQEGREAILLTAADRTATTPGNHHVECVTEPESSGKRKPRPAAGEQIQDCPECPELVVVPSGSHMMGSPRLEKDRYDNEGPVHRVTIEEPFAVGVYEVTFEEWEACVSDGGCGGYRPDDRDWGRGNRPVINVSWNHAQAYVGWLLRKTGQRYRLLSESEWEYVARAGTTGPFHFGETISTLQANYDCYSEDNTYSPRHQRKCRKKTTPVGILPANDYGLHDVHGNVAEWVEDCWNEGYAGAPTDGSAWQSGDCSRRAWRGGAWPFEPRDLRSAYRFGNKSRRRSNYMGFRVARTLTP